MRLSTIHGWVVVFAVTMLLTACASHEARVADTMMSSPDTTATQLDEQREMLERRENALVVNRGWLDEREFRLDVREDELTRRENALVIDRAWTDERDFQLNVREDDLARRENALVVDQAWIDEHRLQLEGDMDRSIQTAEMGMFDEGRCYASVFIPAKYETVAVTKPIEVPAGDNFPVIYQTVTEQTLVSEGRVEFAEILCDSERTYNRISNLQMALDTAGYNPGPIDGLCGPETMAAVNTFQRDNDLIVTGHLTIETLDALGVQ